MTTSAPLALIPEGIPESLRPGKRFVGWRSEARKGQPKPAKMPYSPNAPKGASSTALADWVAFDEAVRYAQAAGLDGIMRAFDHADGLVGFDLDNCLDPTIATPTVDDLAPWAAAIVKRLDTYTDVSPSRTGVKLWVEGFLPPSGRKRGDVEMYGSVDGQTGPCGRFFTMTGHQLAGTPSEVGYRPDAVAAIHREVFGEERAPIISDVTDVDRAIPALELGDDEVIHLAADSKHSGDRFRRLWDGDSSDYASGGNDGESEADAGLFELLAFYGGPDPEKIERIARRSHRVREKWDRQADYLKRSIAFVLKGRTRFYGDSARLAAPVGSDGASGCTCVACPDRAEVARLRGLLLDRDDNLEHLRDRLARTEADLERERTARAQDRRTELASIKLDACPMYSAGQKADIKAVARLGPALANSLGIPDPIITGPMVAAITGAKPKTVNDHLKVFDLPDSPITRTLKPYGVETRYHYAIGGMTPDRLIDVMTDLGNALEKRPPSRIRPRCTTCPEGTGQILNTVCAGCGSLLDSEIKRAPTRKGTKNRPLQERLPTHVSVDTYGDEKPPLAASADAPSPEGVQKPPLAVLPSSVPTSDDAERAAAMVGTELTATRAWLTLVPSPDAVAEQEQAYLAEWSGRPSPFDQPLLVAGGSDEQPPGVAPPDLLDGRDPETGIPWGFV